MPCRVYAVIAGVDFSAYLNSNKLQLSESGKFMVIFFEHGRLKIWRVLFFERGTSNLILPAVRTRVPRTLEKISI